MKSTKTFWQPPVPNPFGINFLLIAMLNLVKYTFQLLNALSLTLDPPLLFKYKAPQIKQNTLPLVSNLQHIHVGIHNLIIFHQSTHYFYAILVFAVNCDHILWFIIYSVFHANLESGEHYISTSCHIYYNQFSAWNKWHHSFILSLVYKREQLARYCIQCTHGKEKN